MIFVRNSSLLYPKRDEFIRAGVEMEGRFLLESFKVDQFGRKIEKSKKVLAEFPNLILNQGMDRMGIAQPNIFNACQVGTGSATPANSDTALQSFLAGTTTKISGTSSVQPSSPYYGQFAVVFEFGVGAAAGNLTEIGVGWSTPGNLFSRALIVDSGGNPITITILSDEILQVTYSLRLYPVEADTSAVVTISGTNYTFTRRPSQVNVLGAWGLTTGISAMSGFLVSPFSGQNAYSSGLGPITGNPSGSAAASNSGGNAAYTNGNYYRDASLVWSIGDANFGAGGIQGFVVQSTNGEFQSAGTGRYQYGVSPAIPKVNTQVLTLNHRMSWARRTI